MIICGIDPGNTGAIAFIESDVLSIEDMPINSKGDFIDVTYAHSLLSKADEIWIEHVHARPTDGRSSLAKFMMSFGSIRSAALLTGKPVNLILPNQWKKRLDLIKKEKMASLELARELYPQALPYLKRKKDHNRAEALLIAHFGRLHNDNYKPDS